MILDYMVLVTGLIVWLVDTIIIVFKKGKIAVDRLLFVFYRSTSLLNSFIVPNITRIQNRTVTT